MKRVRFHTPENVEVTYEPAGPGTRFIAYALDQLFINIPFVLIILTLSILQGGIHKDIISIEKMLSSDKVDSLFWYILAIIYVIKFALDTVYYSYFEIFREGRTPGKKHFKIQVIQEGGFPLTPTSSFLRNLMRIVDGIPVCWIVPLFSPKHKRFGDYVARTVVISRFSKPRPPRIGLKRLYYTELPYRRFEFDSCHHRVLNEQDLALLDSYFGRRSGMKRQIRHRIVRQMVEKLSKRLAFPVAEIAGQEERFLFELRAFLLEERAKSML